ncbi:uncharacterized protein T551_00899 [Pneumocystis jirovecii RU7]|uniref:Uncharacterized protein n=1 Tax=Pneumocystis jirovecii (strain RU7) TaxID=1408657 RepID=A0A0W4ZV26_PNEJ7|nr:uncharacterized protein T551_00899 [Pneumocystis jirovecii RU7]KTW32217.1 hypothetical protein T551_00899 [Pneumocystis jirovecii RU7]
MFYQITQPLSKSAIRAITFLVFFSLSFLIFNFWLISENIILKTSSKIYTSEATLKTRLNHLRQITEYDQKLLERLKCLNGRLLYVLYGPSALGLCEWCEIETPITFLYYIIPHILLHYLINLGIILLSTSVLFEGTVKLWENLASTITFFFFIVELIVLKTYDWKSNEHIDSTLNINWIHWKLNKYRTFFIIALDLFVALIIWFADTNQLHQMPTKEKQLLLSINNLEESINRIRALTIINRAVIIDEFLQKQKMEFYQQEKKRLKELNDSISIKSNMKNTTFENNVKNSIEEIENYAENLVEYLDMMH